MPDHLPLNSAASKRRRHHFALFGHAGNFCCNKISAAMVDNGCDDFYALEANKLDGTTVSEGTLKLVTRIQKI